MKKLFSIMVLATFSVIGTATFVDNASAAIQPDSTRQVVALQGEIRGHVIVTEKVDASGVHTFDLRVLNLRSPRGVFRTGDIGLASGSDGSCYCANLANADYAVSGARFVANPVKNMGWPSDQSLPCSVILTDENGNVVASGKIRARRC